MEHAYVPLGRVRPSSKGAATRRARPIRQVCADVQPTQGRRPAVARNTHVPTGLLGSLVTGAKDIPRNASWLAAKALPHNDETSEKTGSERSNQSSVNGSARGFVRRAGDVV